MKSILITGGACAGKTTSLEMIKNYLSAKGYKVIVIDEVPTNLIKTGIAYEKIGKLEFIELIIKTQINNEKEMDGAAWGSSSDDKSVCRMRQHRCGADRQ